MADGLFSCGKDGVWRDRNGNVLTILKCEHGCACVVDREGGLLSVNGEEIREGQCLLCKACGRTWTGGQNPPTFSGEERQFEDLGEQLVLLIEETEEPHE